MSKIETPVNQRMRALMPVAKKLAYFDHAAVAPISQPAYEAITTWLSQASSQGDLCWPEWAKQVEVIRRRAARLINAHHDEVAFVPNTSSGIGLVAEGMPWKQGDTVVTFENEFPANQYPWMNLKSRGVETRTVTVENGIPSIDRLLESCDHSTRLISISWVSFSSGYRFSQSQLQTIVQEAHQRGILVMLDAIQGLGVFPINVAGLEIDFLAADGHKWMLGPEGAGLFYLRKEHLELLRPLMVGWYSVASPFDFNNIDWEPRPQAARYEGGTQNMVGLLGLGASLEMLMDLGASFNSSSIGTQVLHYTQHTQQLLQSVSAEIFGSEYPEHQSGITSFTIPGVALGAFRKKCLDSGIVLSYRDGRLRISPHAYNNQDDLDRLINVIRSTK